jgi:hypothetical protein
MFLSCVVDVAPDRFAFQESNTQLSIPVFTSHSLDNTNKNLEGLIVIVHGAGLNAGKSFDKGNRIVEELGKSKDQYIVIAPQFLEDIKTEEKGLLFWGRQWRSGGDSLSEGLNEGLPSVGSYEVMDRLIRFITEKYPKIQQIIILGHSAGGQFVSRYAAVNNSHEDLEKQGVSIYYVVANPSSYLYLDATRYQLSSNGEILPLSNEELANCDGYNDYKYGLENLYGYAQSVSKQDIRVRLITRPVLFLIGQEDTEQSWSLDRSCEVEVQGKNRYEKGLLYKHHLVLFSKTVHRSNLHWAVIAGVGHDANTIFTHPTFIKELKTLTYRITSQMFQLSFSPLRSLRSLRYEKSRLSKR